MKVANMVPKPGTLIVQRIRAEESTEGGLAIASNDDEFIAYGKVFGTTDMIVFFHILDGFSFKATDTGDALQDYFLIDESKVLGTYSL